MQKHNNTTIINKIVSPNMGYPCFVSKDRPEFKIIVEVKKEYAETKLLKESLILVSIDKSEELHAKVINAVRINPKDIRDYISQNTLTSLYDYYELTLDICNDLKFGNERFKLFNLLCGKIKNYHSICIVNHDWKHFSFAHITDTHIATRWDHLKQDFSRLFEPIETSTSKFFRKQEFYNKYDSSRNAFSNNFINANLNLREFVKKANELVAEKKLDCIILTGDIVDFAFEDILYIEAKKKKCKNWELFIDILLGNLPNSEELKVPIITIPGNHDYQLAPYRLLWTGLNMMGINRQLQNNYFQRAGETKRVKYAIEDVLSLFVPVRQNPSLRFYVNKLNPFFNFTLTFGKTHFLLMDTGHEHFTYLKNYIGRRLFNMALSVTKGSLINGFEKRQIKFLKSCLKQFSRGDNLMLFFHAPLFSTSYRFTESNSKQGQELVMKIPKIDENDLTTIVEKKSIKFERMLRKRNLNIESVFKNPLPVIDLCLKTAFNVLVFSGHRHINMDCLLERKTRTVRIKEYRKKLENFPFSISNNPFFLITTSLGRIDFLDAFRSLPSYRHITVTDNKVASVKTTMLETRPYDKIQPNVAFVKQKFKNKKMPFLLKIRLDQPKKLKAETKGNEIYHTVTIKFTCGYIFSFYDIELPIELINENNMMKKSETKIFFEKESPYNWPRASKILNFLLKGTDTISFNVGKIKKELNIHRPGFELYFESFVKEKDGKIRSLGIIHYPLRIRI